MVLLGNLLNRDDKPRTAQNIATGWDRKCKWVYTSLTGLSLTRVETRLSVVLCARRAASLFECFVFNIDEFIQICILLYTQ